MQVDKHKVVTIDYTVKDEEGTVIDSSSGGEPLAYIHGTGNLIPGLESALEGKTKGEEVNAAVPPEQAYGERDDALLQAIPRDRFETGEQELHPGMRFQAQSEQGAQVVTVVDVSDEEVTVDANHPLAGATLNFEVKVVDVRDATAEELEHGHVHGPGGHHHA